MSSEYRQAYWNLLMCRSAAAKRGKHYHNHHHHHNNHNHNAQMNINLIQTANATNHRPQKT